MDIDDMTVNDLIENPELIDQLKTSDKYLEAVSSLNQNIDFTGLGQALIGITENLPKIDTTGIATALQNVANVGSALTKSLCLEESAKTLQSVTKYMDSCLCAGMSVECKAALSDAFANSASTAAVISQAFEAVKPDIPALDGLNAIIQEEVNFAQIIDAVIPEVSQISDTFKNFYERFKEIFAFMRERIDEMRQHFYNMIHSLAHYILHGISSVVVYVFRRKVPRSVLAYNLTERLRPPLFAQFERRYMEYAPQIRKVFLHRGRERGNDSDDADFGLLVTC